MQIYANKTIRIDESLSTSVRSSIQIYGSVANGSLAWEERNDLKIFFEEKVIWNEAIASIDFICTEEDKDQQNNFLGWLFMEGSFQFDKESEVFSIRCNCLLNQKKWLQLKNDLLISKKNDFVIEFNINQINSGRLTETEEVIESKIELYMQSYSIVHYPKIS
jgi:hypothetical protein